MVRVVYTLGQFISIPIIILCIRINSGSVLTAQQSLCAAKRVQLFSADGSTVNFYHMVSLFDQPISVLTI